MRQNHNKIVASDEDGDSTAAGEYDSILNVSSQDENEISAAFNL